MSRKYQTLWVGLCVLGLVDEGTEPYQKTSTLLLQEMSHITFWELDIGPSSKATI